jgi:predicted transcriptional regulator
MAENANVLTTKQAAVMEILKDTGAKMFASEIAAANPASFEKAAKSVSPLMTHLVARGLVAKEKASVESVNAEGNAVVKELTRYWATEDGIALEYTIKAV